MKKLFFFVVFLCPYLVSARITIATAPEGTLLNSKALSLQAYVEDSTLFPGQRTHLIYRFLFARDVDLSAEQLPMLEQRDGLRKVGDIVVTERQLAGGNTSEQLVSQLVEAMKPGEYIYGPSYVEGLAYKRNWTGQKIYEKTKLRGEAEKVVLTVLPLPSANRPAAFEGAIGRFSIKSELLSSAHVAVGDMVKVAVTFVGKGEMSSVEFPVLLCQPGFSGLFELSELPVAGVVGTQSKRFEIGIYPLSGQIKAIPSIFFAFFDPITRRYEQISTVPIPITVDPAPILPPKPPQSARNLFEK